MCFSVEAFLFGYLNNPDGIKFREYMGPQMPGLTGYYEGDRKLYKITDPMEFWINLHRNPDQFGFDCLRILSLIVVLEGVNGLLARGYKLSIALKSIEGIVIDGENTYLAHDGLKYYPLWLDIFCKKSHGENSVGMAEIVKPVEFTGNMAGFDLLDLSLRAQIRAGDMFFSGICDAYQSDSRFGNSDSQNGVFMEQTTDLVDANEVCVFGHGHDVETRMSSLYKVLKDLYKNAAKFGDDWHEFEAKGGVFFMVVRRNPDLWVNALEKKIASLRG